MGKKARGAPRGRAPSKAEAEAEAEVLHGAGCKWLWLTLNSHHCAIPLDVFQWEVGGVREGR